MSKKERGTSNKRADGTSRSTVHHDEKKDGVASDNETTLLLNESRFETIPGEKDEGIFRLGSLGVGYTALSASQWYERS